eukprot:1848528-Rhodomonas_salina.1
MPCYVDFDRTLPLNVISDIWAFRNLVHKFENEMFSYHPSFSFGYENLRTQGAGMVSVANGNATIRTGVMVVTLSVLKDSWACNTDILVHFCDSLPNAAIIQFPNYISKGMIGKRLVWTVSAKTTAKVAFSNYMSLSNDV